MASANLGGRSFALGLDVTSEADWKAALSRIFSEWGRLDVLINCAGITLAQAITDLELSDWRRALHQP